MSDTADRQPLVELGLGHQAADPVSADHPTEVVTSCQLRDPGRLPSVEPLGFRVYDSERAILGRTCTGRCYVLWTNLAGQASDFDDLQVECAKRLGWTAPDNLTLPTLLDSTAAVLDAAPWAIVRQLATSLFFDIYDARRTDSGSGAGAAQASGPRAVDPRAFDPRSFDSRCVEPHQRDWRTVDQRADDVQFVVCTNSSDDGATGPDPAPTVACRLCALDPGGDPALHDEVARALAAGRVSWAEVLQVAPAPSAGAAHHPLFDLPQA